MPNYWGPTKRTALQRFWPKVVITNTCWLWTAGKNAYGYGVFWDGKKNRKAHRYSLEIHGINIPEGKVACHKCDNRSCVRPDHFFIGTRKDNTQDAIMKGNPIYFKKGHRPARTVLTEDQVKIIRNSPYGQGVVLAKEYGVNPTAISKIKKGHSWGWLQ